MQRIAIDDVEPDGPGGDRRRLSGPLGTTDVAVSHYRLAPGEGFPGGLHAHADQEEVFVVLDGEATFETLAADRGSAGEVAVGAGEAVRFAPGEFQSGRNDADADLVAFALGAPRDSEDIRVPLACPDCGHPALRPDADEAGPLLACPACDAGHVPGACPDCGHGELQATLDEDGRPVAGCPSCGTEFDEPPVRGRR